MLLLLLSTACSFPTQIPKSETTIADSGGDTDSAADTHSTDSGPDSGRHDTALPPIDDDGDGHASPETGGDDCNDRDPLTYPGASEDCTLPIDRNCDGLLDYADTDGDGSPACLDCDDTNPAAFPGAVEACNGADDDCDRAIDDDLPLYTGYLDIDGDGYGMTDAPWSDCFLPLGYAADPGDCDESDASINPGEIEACDTRDEDCSGTADDSGACPCTMAYWPDTAHPYMFCQTEHTWPDAAALCATYDYRLATLDSAEELAWVQATAGGISSHTWWLGFTDIASEGAWVWEDESPTSYINWCSGEPNNSHGLECDPSTSEEDCAMLNWGEGGCWNDYPCGCGTPYAICEGRSEDRPDNGDE